MFIKAIKYILKRRTARRNHGLLYANLNIGRGTHCTERNLDTMFPQLIEIGEACIFAPTAVVLAHDASYYSNISSNGPAKC